METGDLGIDAGRTDRRSSRRGLLRIGGAAAAGAAAGAFVKGGVASAANGQPVLQGANNTATATTTITAPVANVPALVGDNETTSGIGVAGVGFYGVVGSTVFTDGYGVYSDGPFAINSIGPVPPVDGTAWVAGDIMCSTVDFSLWICTVSGTPGTWQKLGGGTATAGAFHPIDPTRVFDSRIAEGRIASGGALVVSVKDGHDLTTGAVTVADLVPAGATAIAFNLVAAATAAAGFIAITPGDAATFAASTINWGSPTTVANGGIVKLDGSRQVKLFVGGPGASADAIIDVTGYYR